MVFEVIFGWVAFIGSTLYIQGQPNFSICICTYICICTHICICRYICICIYVCIYTYICICTCIFGLYFLAGGMHRANIIQSRTTQFGKVFVFSADSMWATLVTNSKIKSSPHRNIIPSGFFWRKPIKIHSFNFKHLCQNLLIYLPPHNY